MIGKLKFPLFYQHFLPEFQETLEKFILGGQYIGGPFVESFENQVCQYTSASYAIGCKSGTHALQLALLTANIGPGDEVITVANTYYATAWAIVAIGAKPVFCDVRLVDGLIDPSKIEAFITSRTRAILPVHLYGHCVNLDEIRQLAELHHLHVIEV